MGVRIDGNYVRADGFSYRCTIPKYIIVNKWDRALQPVRVFLPKPPDLKYVINVNKRPEEQVFTPTKLPQRLLDIEKVLMSKFDKGEVKEGGKPINYSRAKFIVYMWNEIKSNYKEYKNEIEFIKTEYMRLMYGAWYMIDKEVQYFPGWYYLYINYWSMEGVSPAYMAKEHDRMVEYRDKDRLEFIFDEYLYTTDENEFYQPTGNRTFYGKTRAKHRRDGATNKSLCQLTWVKLFNTPIGGSCGIQANDGNIAEANFAQKLIPAYLKFPFYIQAAWAGSEIPKDRIRFDPPPTRMSAGYKTLGGIIDFATTKESSYYDGKKQYYHLSDENGKLKDVDANDRLGVVKETLAQGANIIGFISLPSTVEEMDSKGGAEFFRLNNQSAFYDRDALGRTSTGLSRYFDTCVNGLEGFVDKFGKSVIFDPAEKDYWRLKSDRPYGALSFIMSRRKKLKDSGKVDDADTLALFKQRFPIEYMEAFSNAGGGVGWDSELLSTQQGNLRLMDAQGERKYTKVRLMWEKPNGERMSADDFVGMGLHRVKGITDSWDVVIEFDDNSDMLMSHVPKIKNKKVKVGEHYYPSYPGRFTASNDTFTHYTETEKNNKTNQSKNGTSKGALTIFWEMEEEDKTKNVADMTSYRYVLSYLGRPSDDVFNEMCLMACVLYGADMFPENNIDNTIKYFEDRGYYGYLLYDVDVSTGKPKPKPGFKSGSETKQKLFKSLGNYQKNHIRRVYHPDIIEQWAAIKSMDDMTFYDLVTSTGGCLLGSESRLREFKFEKSIPEKQDNLLDYYNFI